MTLVKVAKMKIALFVPSLAPWCCSERHRNCMHQISFPHLRRASGTKCVYIES